ncbi:hypothetical protein GW7_17914 [Heterocephalus glaber]|uniref:Uncharacterized protein n=1 Tax=Heterocephalus glaber TaxID=10181 RepID=G5BF37_HETGA|nr:hypothetical protein GW7_17914 [Heterocephalus glaber]
MLLPTPRSLLSVLASPGVGSSDNQAWTQSADRQLKERTDWLSERRRSAEEPFRLALRGLDCGGLCSGPPCELGRWSPTTQRATGKIKAAGISGPNANWKQCISQNSIALGFCEMCRNED